MIRRAIARNRICPSHLTPTAAIQKRWSVEVFVPADMPKLKAKWNAVEVVKTVTETMKNVAAGKLPFCERMLRTVRPFAGVMSPFFELKTAPKGPGFESVVHVALATERGLCGGVGTNVPLTVGNIIKKDKKTKSARTHKIAVYGKKGMTKLTGMIPLFINKIDIGFGNVKMRDPNFMFCCDTVDRIMELEWDVAKVYYNTYINMQVFRLESKEIYSLPVCEEIAGKQFPAYEIEGDEGTIVQNLREYKFATMVYHGMAEQAAAEQGSRLMSMEGAVKACKDKSAEYQKIYMKLRQTKITSELIILAAGVQSINMAGGRGDFIQFKNEPGDTKFE